MSLDSIVLLCMFVFSIAIGMAVGISYQELKSVKNLSDMTSKWRKNNDMIRLREYMMNDLIKLFKGEKIK